MKLRDRMIASIRRRQKVWKHDRSKTVGASEVFACLRKGWYAKNKPELEDQDAKNWGILERGNMIENLYAVPALADIFGADNCLYMGDDQVTFIHGTASATPDSLLINLARDTFAADGLPDIGPSLACGGEIKSFDTRANINAAKTIHRGQAVMQLGMFRRQTKFLPDHSMVIYINSADLSDIRPYPVAYSEETYQAGLKRSARIMTATDPYELPAEGVYTDQCKFCPFVDACRKTEIDRFPSHKSNYTDNELNVARSMAMEHAALAAKEKEAEAEKKKLAEDIKRFMAEVGTKGIEGDDFKLTYSMVGDGKETLDKDALNEFLKANGTSLEDFTVDGKPYTRLTVTVKGDGGGK